MLEPKPVFDIKKDSRFLTINPTKLTIPDNAPLELFGEPQSGKTFYGLWLVKKLAEQKNCNVLIVRCEKFDSGFVETVCNEIDFNPDIIDIYPPNSPADLMAIFGMDDRRFRYEVNDKTGKIEIAFFDTAPLDTIKKSTAAKYGIIFIDTLTSVFNVITNSGLKNFPPRNQYEQILFTMAELFSLTGGMFVSTHEHTKDVTNPYSTIEVKGGKEVERRHDHVLRLHTSGSGDRKEFYIYAKRWPLIAEGELVCKMRYNSKTKSFAVSGE